MQEQTQGITEQELLARLQQRGVLDEILNRLRFESPVGATVLKSNGDKRPVTHFINEDDKLLSEIKVKKANVDPTRRHLFLELVSGRAFLEHLNDHDVDSSMTVHIHFRGQRFHSQPTPCACEPNFREIFVLELHKETAGSAARMADGATLLSLCDPIHLVVTKTNRAGDTTIVSSHFVDWRRTLLSADSRCTVNIELMGIGSLNKVIVGIVEMRLELRPKLLAPLIEEVLSTQQSLERSNRAQRERLFITYAKRWWDEFLQIRPTHNERLVKIFARDENCINRPVCSYVRPLRAGRLLDSPLQAARFVSLIGYDKAMAVGGGGRAEQWTSMHAFLCRGKGDCEDHSVLLCSLLLGFGLDAYVCVGTKLKGATHTWVATINADGRVTFWESLTGDRYPHVPVDPDDLPIRPGLKPPYPYRTIGCVFNHELFFANAQPTDFVHMCVFDLNDGARWKSMSDDAIRSVCDPGVNPEWPSFPPLCATPLDAVIISNELEHELRALVVEHRRDQGLTTVWDDHLSYILSPALSAYETERLTGITAGNEEFQQAVHRAVPDGHTFKGYPVQLVHRNARRAFTSCLKSDVCEAIINCRGDQIRLAIRVRVYVYPESTCATWLMFACRHKVVL
jgi:centrosomal protein CEP76